MHYTGPVYRSPPEADTPFIGDYIWLLLGEMFIL